MVGFEVGAASVSGANQLASTLTSLVQDTSSALYSGSVTSSLDATSLSASVSVPTPVPTPSTAGSSGGELPVVAIAGAAGAVFLCCAAALYMLFCRTASQAEAKSDSKSTDDSKNWSSPDTTPGVLPHQKVKKGFSQRAQPYAVSSKGQNTGVLSGRGEASGPMQATQPKPASVFT